MNQGLTQAIASDRLGLADFHEISDLLLCTGLFCFRVASWSMYPALWKGDQLTVEPASPTSLQVGDVILFHQCGQLICHRVVALETAGPLTQIVTKGDAAVGCDTPLQPDQVLGLVVAVKRSGLRCAGLAILTDRWRARLSHWVTLGLLRLQSLRAYRRMMRTLFSRCFAYDVGIPEGRRWFRYYPVRGGRTPGVLRGHQRFHLLAKLGGSTVASLHVVPRAEEYWLEALYVRLRYRGLGVGSHLLALAAAAASRSRPPVLLASVEPANTAALHLFTKAGFRKTGGLRGNQVSLRRDL